MRVLVFGDSITQGYWGTEGGWVERIRKHYDTIQVTDLEGKDEPTLFNLGISADNSKKVLDRIVSETISRTRHGNLPVVIVQVGMNDSSIDAEIDSESVSLSIEQYGRNLRAIIEKVTLVSSKIILVGLTACDESRTTPVPWGDFHYMNKAIKKYENTMRDIAAEHEVSFIPVFDVFIEKLRAGEDYLPDGLHPNNDGHAFISKVVMNELVDLLAE